VANVTGGYLPLVCTLNATKVTDTMARLLAVDHATLTALALKQLAENLPDVSNLTTLTLTPDVLGDALARLTGGGAK
jgi:hypothetical protein